MKTLQKSSLISNNRRQWLRASAALPIVGSPILLSACGGGEGIAVGEKNIVVQWNEVFLKAVRAGTLGPPMVSRAMAIMNTAIFDTWALTKSNVKPTQIGLPRAGFKASTTDLNTAFSYAAYRALVNLYPEQKAFFDTEMANRALDINYVEQTAATPAGLGNAAAAKVLEFRSKDGSNQMGDLAAGAYRDYTGYTPVNTAASIVDPNRWQPLVFANGKAPGFMVPHWGRVIPFSIERGDALRPIVNLPRFGSVEYKEAVDYVLNTTANLTDEQKVISEYWANGPASETPPGHWNGFLQKMSVDRGHSLSTDVKLFFALSNAVMDAGIVCWDCKRTYDSVRPVTAVRALYAGQTVVGFRGTAAGQGIGPMQGETWHPYQSYNFTTPPFAEFTSGHSTFSASSAEVLKLLTGSDHFGFSTTITAGDPVALFEANVPAQPVTLSFSTFSAAAEQAGLSRIYGGIHFPSGNSYGLTSGKKLGDTVVNALRNLLAGERESNSVYDL
jgi:PAP2 superfamily